MESSRRSCKSAHQTLISFLTLFRFSLRRQVEDANTTRLNALPGDMLVYGAVDIPGHDIHDNRITRERATKLLDDSLAPRELRLRVGAQVMLIKVRQCLFSARLS